MMCLLHDIFNVVRHINDPPRKKKKIELDFIVVAFLLLWVGGWVLLLLLCFAFAPLANLLFSVVVLNF